MTATQHRLELSADSLVEALWKESGEILAVVVASIRTGKLTKQ
jgi:hypothetical protein